MLILSFLLACFLMSAATQSEPMEVDCAAQYPAAMNVAELCEKFWVVGNDTDANNVHVTLFAPRFKRMASDIKTLHALCDTPGWKTLDGVVEMIVCMASERPEADKCFYSSLLDRSVTDVLHGYEHAAVRWSWRVWSGNKTQFDEDEPGSIRLTVVPKESQTPSFVLEGTFAEYDEDEDAEEDDTLDGYVLYDSRQLTLPYEAGIVFGRNWIRL